MNFNEVQELIKLITNSNLSEFKLKDKDFEVLIRTDKYQKGNGQTYVTSPQSVSVMPQMQAPAVQSGGSNSESRTDEPTTQGGASKGKNILEIKSPIVGTFYRSAGPDKPTFAKVGDQVKSGDVVCIIEAMKLFNEIESDVTGTVVKVLVEDASPVEYDQVLFLVEV